MSVTLSFAIALPLHAPSHVSIDDEMDVDEEAPVASALKKARAPYPGPYLHPRGSVTAFHASFANLFRVGFGDCLKQKMFSVAASRPIGPSGIGGSAPGRE